MHMHSSCFQQVAEQVCVNIEEALRLYQLTIDGGYQEA